MIFPKEILEFNASVYVFKNKTRTKIIYSSTLLFLIISFLATKYIYTEIYVSTRGILGTASQKEIIVSPKSGFVEVSAIKFNKSIGVGDTLLKLDVRSLENQTKELDKRLTLSRDIIADLNYLLFAKEVSVKNLKTSKQLQGFTNYEQKQRIIEGKILAKKRVLERQESLFEAKVISESEIENDRFEYDALIEEKSHLRAEQKFLWEKERQVERLNRVGLETQIKNLENEKGQYYVIAQRAGTLLNVREITKGKYLNAGESLAELSEDGKLIVELYLPPSKIGLIKINDSINFQIDAYNYRNWGLAKGIIQTISKDIEIIDNQPVFKIIASVNQEYLTLKNGARGEFKKGLTLSARIKIANRSFFDLLYDKVDDWINPSQNQLAQYN